MKTYYLFSQYSKIG